MPRRWLGLTFSVTLFAGLALLVLGVASVSVASAQSVKDPLKLFEPMYPVFSSERCANCHGDVNVVTGDGHPGGPVPDAKVDKDGGMCCNTAVSLPCASCHDENAVKDDADNVVGSPWKLPPTSMAFAGKDLKEMCKTVRDHNALAGGDKDQWNAFINHLGSDELIGMAFEGLRAITPASPEGPVGAEPPPLDRASFVQAAIRWLNEGKARCGPWNGTVSETITRRAVNPLLEDILDAQIDITIQDGDGTAHVKVDGHIYSKGQACSSHRDTFKVNADNVPVDVNILINRDMFEAVGLPNGINLPSGPGGASLPPGVPQPNLGDDGYSMIFRLGNVKGTDHFEDRPPSQTCPLSTGDHDYTFNPPVVNFFKQLDPDDPDHLHGTDTQKAPDGTLTIQWDLTRLAP